MLVGNWRCIDKTIRKSLICLFKLKLWFHSKWIWSLHSSVFNASYKTSETMAGQRIKMICCDKSWSRKKRRFKYRNWYYCRLSAVLLLKKSFLLIFVSFSIFVAMQLWQVESREFTSFHVSIDWKIQCNWIHRIERDSNYVLNSIRTAQFIYERRIVDASRERERRQKWKIKTVKKMRT